MTNSPLTAALHPHSSHSTSRTRVIHLAAAGADRALCGKRIDADRTASYLAGDGITTRFDRPCAKCEASR